MAITPPDIALAMRRMGWNNASALMTRWVNGSAWTMTKAIKDGKTDPTTLSATQVDTSTITMHGSKASQAHAPPTTICAPMR